MLGGLSVVPFQGGNQMSIVLHLQYKGGKTDEVEGSVRYLLLSNLVRLLTCAFFLL